MTQIPSRKDFAQELPSSTRQLENYLESLAAVHAGSSPTVPPALSASARAQQMAMSEAIKQYTKAATAGGLLHPGQQYIANASAAVRVGAGQRPSAQGIPFAASDANLLLNPYLLAGMGTLPYSYNP